MVGRISGQSANQGCRGWQAALNMGTRSRTRKPTKLRDVLSGRPALDICKGKEESNKVTIFFIFNVDFVILLPLVYPEQSALTGYSRPSLVLLS